MAVNVGNPSAHSPHHSFRARPALRAPGSYVQALNLSSTTLSTEEWPRCLVQRRFRRSMPSLRKNILSSSRSSQSIVTSAVQVQSNGRSPPQDTLALTTQCPVEHSPLSISISPKPTRSEEKLGSQSVLDTAATPLIQVCQGEFLENRMLYRQKYVIRSYQVKADKTTSITTIFGFFQDIFLCHFHFMGIASRDGFGATDEMHRLGQIWVVTKMHVEVDSFPIWPDVIEIDASIAQAGKNGMRYDWIVRRHGTNEVLVRATSTWCMMDSTTRRVCKMPDAVRAELSPFFWDDRHVISQQRKDSRNITQSLPVRIPKLESLTAKYITPALKSSWADLDLNQHVTNASYIRWLLQSVPKEHLETHSLTSIVIEYRRECKGEDTFESLTSAKKVLDEDDLSSGLVPNSEFTHLLRDHHQDLGQQEIARARTTWRPKPRLDSTA